MELYGKSKQELLERAAYIKQMFLERKLSPEHMNKFMSLYRVFFIASRRRLLHLVPQIEQNIADRREQDIAFERLKQFSSAIINRAVDKADANRYIDSLVKGRFNSIEESMAIRLPAEEVNQWLDVLQIALSQIPAEKLKAHSTMPQELEKNVR